MNNNPFNNPAAVNMDVVDALLDAVEAGNATTEQQEVYDIIMRLLGGGTAYQEAVMTKFSEADLAKMDFIDSILARVEAGNGDELEVEFYNIVVRIINESKGGSNA